MCFGDDPEALFQCDAEGVQSGEVASFDEGCAPAEFVYQEDVDPEEEAEALVEEEELLKSPKDIFGEEDCDINEDDGRMICT